MKLQCTILLFGFILINASDENSQTSWHPSSFQVPGPLWGVRLRNHIAAWTSIPSDEVSRLRLLLDSQGWAEARELFSDKYLEKVLVAESRGRGTAVESAAERLSASLKWRREYGVAHIRKKDVARALAPNHMFWGSSDAQGCPILYVRAGMVDLDAYDREEYLKAHVFLLEQGLPRLNTGSETFVLVSDATGLTPRHLDLGLMRSLLHVLEVGYPHRLDALVVGPVSGVLRAFWALLSRLAPSELTRHLRLVSSPRLHLLPRLHSPAPPWLP